MSDGDLFGVQDPDSGEVGYCGVLGQLGEVFGLSVYRGAEGLHSYRRVFARDLGYDDTDLLVIMKCLMVEFEERSALNSTNRNLIKTLGMNFPGKHAWPQFRSFSPGYFPWFLDASETRFLAVVLEQAIEIGRRTKETPFLLTPDRGRCLVRVPQKEGGQLVWTDQWLELPDWKPPSPQPIQPDEDRISRIHRANYPQKQIWELDFFYSPSPVQEGKDARPFFPYVCMVVDQESDFILAIEFESSGTTPQKFVPKLLDLIEEHKIVPQEIQFKQPETGVLLGPTAQRLNIRLVRVETLQGLDSVRKDFLKSLARGG